jgi:hypothetical protein
MVLELAFDTIGRANLDGRPQVRRSRRSSAGIVFNPPERHTIFLDTVICVVA